MSKVFKITDFAFDDKNFNKHTDDGMALLQKSIEKVGVIDAITVSSDDKVISGNARKEKITAVMSDVEPIVVETNGRIPVVIMSTDIASGTKEFHEAALLANTTAKRNIELDNSMIRQVAIQEFDIGTDELGYAGSRLYKSLKINDIEFDDRNMQFPITIIASKSEFDMWCSIRTC
jgi:hypothetical protein